VQSSPNLQFSTAPFFRHPVRDAFRNIASAGYSAVEVMVTADPATQEPHLLRDLAEEHELRIDTIHAPMLLVTRRVWGSDPITKIYRSVQLAQAVGAGVVVAHPPYRWQVRYRRWLDTSVEELSERSGVTIAVENMFPVKVRGERGLTFHASQDFEDLERYPSLVLDTSHAAVSRIDILDAVDRYRDNMVHVHVSNNAGKGWDSHLPVYDGILPIGPFLERLASNGFGGSVSIELDLRPWFKDEDGLQATMVKNKEFCEAALGVRA
jgi:sugar phosphate isomerase/epimerase